MKLGYRFGNSWQEDFFRSQLRFLPEPPPDPEWIGDQPQVWADGSEYWAVLWVSRGPWLQRLRRSPWSVPLWNSEKDHFCFAFPSILLSDV